MTVLVRIWEGGKYKRCRWTYGERVEAFLASGVPYFVAQYTVIETAFLSQEGRADGRLLVLVKFVGDLAKQSKPSAGR